MSCIFDTVEFLKNYEEHPCLWNKSLPEFRNRVKRNAAEEQLLPLSGFANIKELRAKIRSIRGTYNQEVTKIKKSMRTGFGINDIYKPKLHWFPYADSFLRKNIELYAETESNFIIEDQNVNEEQHEELGNLTLILTKKRPLPQKCVSISNVPKCKKVDTSLDEADKTLKEVYSSRSSNNEFSLFGQLIATQLSQLLFEEAIVLQQEIQNKVNEARIRNIRYLNF